VLARLRHHRFYSLAELNKAIANLITDLNRRPFRRLDGTLGGHLVEAVAAGVKVLDPAGGSSDPRPPKQIV
jgi:hypothetical protein